MSENVPYADIIILALIAGFILLRLRSVLGTRSEDDPAGFNRLLPMRQDQEAVVQLDEKSLKNKPREDADSYMAALEGGTVKEGLQQIKDKDPQFSASEFLYGARLAYEMVFDAFAKGDKPTLKMLLSDSIYQHFVSEIDAREKQQNHTETTLVSVAAKEITEAKTQRTIARLSVKFVSEQVTLVKDAKGTVIEGNPSQMHQAEDHWSFERDVTSKNPNWKVVET